MYMSELLFPRSEGENPSITHEFPMTREVDALGVITISRGYFERCCSNKKTHSYHSNL